MMYWTKRMQCKVIAFGAICSVTFYLGWVVGFYLAGDEDGVLRQQRDKFTAIFKEHSIGNYEPSGSDSPVGVGPGTNGEPVTFEDWETQAVHKSMRYFSFNQYVSDKIPLDRSIPDLRSDECRSWHYPTLLPPVSVIIPFYNEGWSTLLRTITSLVNRTPSDLLQEIILVDDFSSKSQAHVELQKQLATYITTSTQFKDIVHIVRNRRRLGIMASRMEGARRASGRVLVFMDAHCEVGINWLPSLLTLVTKNSTTVALPTIDIIDNMAFNIYPLNGGKLTRGMFDWDLNYQHVTHLPHEELVLRQHHTEPYRTPVMSGHVFAINKAYFFNIGGYDPGLRMGGGENFELSFKVWMCGGSLMSVPCSHVGHLDRINDIPPYTYPGDTPNNYKAKNLLRIASIWMDEYRDYVYISKPSFEADNIAIGDIKPQLMFRQEKQCHNFNWYMQEVAYDLLDHFHLPPLSLRSGEIRVLTVNVCVNVKGTAPIEEGSPLGLFKCHGLGGTQLFRLTTDGDIRVSGFCLGQHSSGGPVVIVTDCRDKRAIKDWTYDEENLHLRRGKAHQCLQRSGTEIQLQPCAQGVDIQLWTFENPK